MISARAEVQGYRREKRNTFLGVKELNLDKVRFQYFKQCLIVDDVIS